MGERRQAVGLGRIRTNTIQLTFCSFTVPLMPHLHEGLTNHALATIFSIYDGKCKMLPRSTSQMVSDDVMITHSKWLGCFLHFILGEKITIA